MIYLANAINVIMLDQLQSAIIVISSINTVLSGIDSLLTLSCMEEISAIVVVVVIPAAVHVQQSQVIIL